MVTTHNEWEKRIIEILDMFIPEPMKDHSDETIKSVLHIIVSDSVQAIRFVTLIESEFEVELDDEYINYDFFSSMDYIIDAIEKSAQS